MESRPISQEPTAISLLLTKLVFIVHQFDLASVLLKIEKSKDNKIDASLSNTMSDEISYQKSLWSMVERVEMI